MAWTRHEQQLAIEKAEWEELQNEHREAVDGVRSFLTTPRSMRPDVSATPSNSDSKRMSDEMSSYFSNVQKFMSGVLKQQTEYIQKMEDGFSLTSVKSIQIEGRVHALQSKLGIQEKELKRSKLQIKVMEKNIELLLQVRAAKSTVVPVPSQPGMDFMSQPTQY
ncbi:hypothetical protein AAP_00848 [Ascosphaera apis ARSEF 7405]|uniref:Uncharacterized protein n=1 Tax=Ascosphaera apis ARSEF 7405 TaxID=392613 RepID=A0A168CZQ5_9EURO|nr:hypothetical protein AAP_00848 [Ascosphaera apis ARSEF 7405]